MTKNNSFARAQAQYDAMTPPEPTEATFEADVIVTLYLHIDALSFDVGWQQDQMQDYMRDELMPRLLSAVQNEAGRRSVEDSEFDITAIHAQGED